MRLIENCCSKGMSVNVRKRIFWNMRSTKTQISLRIRAVWLESSLSAWRNFTFLEIKNAPIGDSTQTAWMRRLIWIYAGRSVRRYFFFFFFFWRCGYYNITWSYLMAFTRYKALASINCLWSLKKSQAALLLEVFFKPWPFESVN